jgi:hypothetical protein
MRAVKGRRGWNKKGGTKRWELKWMCFYVTIKMLES